MHSRRYGKLHAISPAVTEDHFRSSDIANSTFTGLHHSTFSGKKGLCLCLFEGTMFRAGLRSTWGAISRPAPTNPWQTFFRTNLQKRTLINSSRDNRWPRSPILPEGKGFNWDAFRWTNYRVASTLLLGVWLM